MNLNCAIQTKRLMLLPGNNARDNSSFLQMLKEDGDFYLFCGVTYSDENLLGFSDYFEREIMFAIYLRDHPEKMIGYIGLAERHGRYEVEFYIKKSERRKGYCSEALQALCGSVFSGRIVTETGDGTRVPLTLHEIYATTLEENEPTRKLLERHSFQKPMEGFIMALYVRVDPITGEEYVNHIVEYVLQRAAFEK